jgi:uncharacterized NAD-dependent epimerase/dehydratase family protein
MEIAAPYLIFLGDAENPLDAKTGRGLVDWRPERCFAQLRLPGCAVDLGLPEMTPEAARAAGARTLVVGVAPAGGRLEAHWIGSLVAALAAGLDVASGLHTRLGSFPELVAAAARSGARLIDVRVPGRAFPVASGRKRSGRRLLTVGTDCAVGKKYTALCLERGLAARGVDATFRATGQTGILIAGEGVPIDAVVADFVAGAAECLTPDAAPDHWDVIEGQGSLFHPGYAAVSLGLLHGSQPDALVVCHDAARTTIDEYPDYPLPDLATCIERHLAMGRLTNPRVRCVGVSVNTSGLAGGEGARRGWLAEREAATGLPCVDPWVDGVGPILDLLLADGGRRDGAGG